MLETEDIQYTRLRMSGVKCWKEKISDVTYHVGMIIGHILGVRCYEENILNVKCQMLEEKYVQY